MKILFVLSLIISCTFCENKNNEIPEINDTYIPYRTGNKYGLVNKDGKEIIKPTYDWVEFANIAGTFIGYKTDSNGAQKSDYIYGGKVILKNQPYKYYSFELGLIETTQILQQETADGQPKRNENLFTLNGKKLFKQELDGLHVFRDFEEDNPPKDILIKTVKNEKGSYYLFNVRKQELTPIFENADIYNIDYQFNGRNTKYIITYSINNDKQQKVFISSTDDSYTISTENISEIVEKKEFGSGNFEKAVDGPKSKIKKEDTDTQIPENAIFKMPYIQYVSSQRHLPAEPSKIVFKDYHIEPSRGYIFTENEKYGLKITINNQPLYIPAKYDEIIKSSSGYIIRNGNKYGYVSDPVYSHGKQAYIEPIFDYFPTDVFVNYNKIENFHIVPLYDIEKNEFACYGDSTGKLYYSEK